MADQEQDRSEAATPFKLEEARRKGSVPKSMDINSFVVLLVGVCVLSVWGGGIAHRELSMFRTIFANAHQTNFELGEMAGSLVDLLSGALLLVAPLFLGVMALGALANFLQTGPVFSFFPLKPDVERINPVAGFKRVFSIRLLVEAVKTVLKFVLLGLVLFFAVKSALPVLLRSMNVSAPALGTVFLPEAAGILFKMLAALAFVVLIDAAYSRWDFARRMRMSRREIKDEVKRREGDPRVKSRLRELQREARKRSQSLGRVKDADVLITNPVRLAVAIRYDKACYDAPMVIAKGAGSLARLIRREARCHGVPVVENRPLARALFRHVRIDEAVPRTHFGVMAKILVWAYAMRRGTAAGGVPR